MVDVYVKAICRMSSFAKVKFDGAIYDLNDIEQITQFRVLKRLKHFPPLKNSVENSKDTSFILHITFLRLIAYAS